MIGAALCGCAGQPRYRAYILPADRCVRPDCYRDPSETSASAPPAAAASYKEPPVFDSEVTCRAAKAFGGSYCLTDEKKAQALVIKKWSTFTLEERRSCVDQTLSYNPSYVETLTCLEFSHGSTLSTSPFTPYVSPKDRGPLPDYANPENQPK